MRVDLTADDDMDRVAGVAFGITEKLRESDLRELHNEIVSLCRWHPVKAAQIMTALAAWFDPETPCRVLWSRVEAITASRVKAAMQ
jgi:hypothetical protein